jgi:hypothetical protein
LQKYFRIRPEIQKKIDDYVESRFSKDHIIAIHYRGTDKGCEAVPVPHAEVIETTKNYISQNQLTNYKIFIATDEQEMVSTLLDAFGTDHVIGYSTQRSQNGAPLHFGNSDPSGHGEEALIDAVLLSKGDILIRTSSNLSRWSTYLNPTLPVIELNHRH